MATPTFAFGGGVFTPPSCNSSGDVEEFLRLLEECGIKIIDTGAIYGESEKLLGEAKAASRFTIDTKAPGGLGPEPSTKDVVAAYGKESLEKLGTSQVCIQLTQAEPGYIPPRDPSILIAFGCRSMCTICMPQTLVSPSWRR